MVRGVSRDLARLYLAQGAAYLFPFLTFPYLSRTLGPEGFGSLALAQSLGAYLQVVADYAFSTLGVRESASSIGDREKLRRAVWGVASAKLLLAFALGALAGGATHLLPPLREQPLLGLGALAWALGWGALPVWFFLGVGRTDAVILLEVGSRTLATLAIFALVREPHQAFLPPLLSGGSFLLWAALGWYWIHRQLGKPVLKLRDGLTYLRAGWPLFLSRSAVALYTSVNPLILGHFVPPGQVGIYAGADRLVQALLGTLDPLGRAFFPRLSRLVAEDAGKARNWARRVFLAQVALGALMSLSLLLAAPLAVSLFLGPHYGDAVRVLRILSPIPLLVAASNAMGAQWMLALRLDRAFAALLGTAAGINLLLAPVLAWKYGPEGLAWGVVAVEAWVTLAMLLHLSREGAWFFGRKG